MQQDILKEIHRWDHVLNFNWGSPDFVYGDEEDPLEQRPEREAWENRTLSRKDAVGLLHRAAAYLKFDRNDLYDNAALLLLERKAKVEKEILFWEGCFVYV